MRISGKHPVKDWASSFVQAPRVIRICTFLYRQSVMWDDAMSPFFLCCCIHREWKPFCDTVGVQVRTPHNRGLSLLHNFSYATPRTKMSKPQHADAVEQLASSGLKDSRHCSRVLWSTMPYPTLPIIYRSVREERPLPSQPDLGVLYRGQECNRVFKFCINHCRNAESMSTMLMNQSLCPGRSTLHPLKDALSPWSMELRISNSQGGFLYPECQEECDLV